METTPLYTELVVKYYLSRGLKPFTSETVDVITVPKIKAGDVIGRTRPTVTVHDYLTLMAEAPRQKPDRPNYNYFRL